MAAEQPLSEQEVIRRFQALVAEEKEYVQKLAELDLQALEYKRVLDSIGAMDKARRCYKLINNVLVERTVGEVIPLVEQNAAGIQVVIKGMNENFQKKVAERQAFQRKYNVRMARPEEARAAAAARAQGGGAQA